MRSLVVRIESASLPITNIQKSAILVVSPDGRPLQAISIATLPVLAALASLTHTHFREGRFGLDRNKFEVGS